MEVIVIGFSASDLFLRCHKYLCLEDGTPSSGYGIAEKSSPSVVFTVHTFLETP